jgi:phosphoribosylamine--glycine ligase
MMKVLVIGSGGREHALVWKLSQSPKVEKIYCLPGNGGISDIAECVDIKSDDFESMVKFARRNEIDITVVGPEAPLVAGIVDIFTQQGLKIFGPQKGAARLEGSKVFAKQFMKQYQIPTAEFEVFDDYDKAMDYVKAEGFPIVIKADGLCAGKGSFVVQNLEEAESALRKIFIEKVFGSSGDKVVVEEFLPGEEASIIAIADGENLVPLASSQDHKRAYDNDQGPNTGGMGAYSPAPVAEGEIFDTTIEKVLKPVIRGMKERGIPFKGVLYAGIMIVENEPYVLEFNVRFGDPETQAILPRMDSDLLEIIDLAVSGKLDNYVIKWKPQACVSVVIASGGYPGSYEKGKVITGLEKVRDLEDVVVFHAGTKKIIENGKPVYLTNGGRVLNVTALGEDIRIAKEKAYQAVELINFENMHYRRDIADKALNRFKINT